MVYGPSPDGGYGFLGLGRECPEVFRGIPWSAEDTLARTLEEAEKCGLGTECLSELRDIDDEEDWEQLMKGMLGGKIEKLLEVIS